MDEVGQAFWIDIDGERIHPSYPSYIQSASNGNPQLRERTRGLDAMRQT